ncbi:MAG: hypothetical protein AMS25_02130 [Gemmatimonas sp. SM23_52]|nr:MAG: hypothetical protein AMS25_02130 [Gemmatimonas sp. SM23_52]
MSDPASVDGTSLDELTGKLVLLIEENRAWHETDLMHRQLTAKVKYYVRYIRSPQFTVQHGRRPQDTIVRLVSAHPPGDVSLKFFQRVCYELSKHGVAFEHQVGAHGIPVPLTPSTEATFPPHPPAAQPGPSPEAAAPPPAAGPPPPRMPPERPALAPPRPRPEPAAPPAEPPPPVRPPAKPPIEERPPLEPPPTPEPSLVEGLEPSPAAREPLELEPAMPREWLGEEPARTLNDEISELERLIEGGDEELEFLGIEPRDEAVSVEPEPAPDETERSHPPFFPEEEFGRAMPDMDEVEAIFEAPTAAPVIETSSGKRFRLDAVETPEFEAPTLTRPSLARAIGAGIAAAIGGAVIWGLLALLAGQGASPLALAVAVMVGISVRLQGVGHTIAFRLVGVFFTLLGSLLGAVLAAAALTATAAGVAELIPPDHPVGLTGLLSVLSSPDTALVAVRTYYRPLDLAALGLALYIGFRISATKPSR